MTYEVPTWECGIDHRKVAEDLSNCGCGPSYISIKQITKALVSRAKAEERERCAVLAHNLARPHHSTVASAIRAMGDES